MNEELKQVIVELYELLRDEGFSNQSLAISKLIYYNEVKDLKNFKKVFKSSIIMGGAGSVRDIDLRETSKQEKLDSYLKKIKELTANFN